MPNGQNTGQFGIGLGGVGALKAAMERRGMDAGILDQVSPAAAGPASPVAPPLPADVGQVTPAAPVGAEPTPEAPGPLTPTVRSGEMEIALKALAGTVKTENKIAEATLGI